MLFGESENHGSACASIAATRLGMNAAAARLRWLSKSEFRMEMLHGWWQADFFQIRSVGDSQSHRALADVRAGSSPENAIKDSPARTLWHARRNTTPHPTCNSDGQVRVPLSIPAYRCLLQWTVASCLVAIHNRGKTWLREGIDHQSQES